MRRWLAALALVPVVAWGQQMSAQECMSQPWREKMLRSAMNIADAQDRGVTERDLIETVIGAEDPAVRATFLAGIDHTYTMDIPLSSVADAMQAACYNAAAR